MVGSAFGVKISSGCFRRSCERNIDRAKRTVVEAGSTIQIDSYSAIHLFSISLFLSLPSLSRSLSIVYLAAVLPPTVQYRSIFLLVRLDIHLFPSVSPHPIAHPLRAFFCLSFATAAEKQTRKQSCKALMFRPTAVKHFNLFDALRFRRYLRAGVCRPGLPTMPRIEIPNEFSRNTEYRVYQYAQAR